MDEQPIVDEDALDRLHGLGGNKLVVQMVRLYVENARERMRQIDAGLSPAGTLEGAGAGAHSLKSSAANVGASKVRALAISLEEAAIRGDRETVRSLRESLAAAVDEAEVRLLDLSRGFET